MIKQREHSWYGKVTVEDAANLVRSRNGGVLPNAARAAVEAAYDELAEARETRIDNELHDPLRYEVVLPIWRVVMAVLGFDFLIPDKFGADYGERMRTALGMKHPARVVTCLGGNRSSKTRLLCRVAMECLEKYDGTTQWLFHTDGDMSREYHQTLMHGYMDPNYRDAEIKSTTTYIGYKFAQGFSDDRFVLPNMSRCGFRNYNMDRHKIEGGELGDPQRRRCLGFAADELLPRMWLTTLLKRLTTRAAQGLIGFTPIDGYTATVAQMLDGGYTVRWGKAYMLPRDGGPRDPVRAEQMEDVDEWLTDGGGLVPDDVQEPVFEADDGRVFALRPRVVIGSDPDFVTVFFYSADNPFGNPQEVIRSVLYDSDDDVDIRLYGYTEKGYKGKFPLFSDKANMVPDDAIPARGTDYFIVDPCGGRMWFGLWIRVTSDGRIWVVREFPSPGHVIPGHGFPGVWAEPGDDAKKLDGKMGAGQKNLGWGFAQYKKEFARIEGWECFDDAASDEEIRQWDQFCKKTNMNVFQRFLDARYGNNKSFDDGGQVSLFEELDDWGLTFLESESGSRNSIDDGCRLITDALHYNPQKPIDALNRPRLMVAESCANLRFAMKLYTGADGQKGACKDPIDCLRMFFLKKCGYVEMESVGHVRGGGCY